MATNSVDVGVIGVGSMGEHHARVYSELSTVNLIGVVDADEQRAQRTAADYNTTVMTQDELLGRADAVSVVVPTDHHFDIVSTCIDRGVDALIEKPFVPDPAQGTELIERADANDVTLQVGHIERFNPAVDTLSDLIDDLDVISVRTHRLGPPPRREIQDTVIPDLMIHDIDVVLALLGEEPTSMRAVSVREDKHATATLRFPDDTVATLVASRVTQRKVRTMEITAANCFITVDYVDQTVEIHRRSAPEYIEREGNMRYRHQGIIERPMVDNGEPLKRELESFAETVAAGRTPKVTAEEGVRAVEYARQLSSLAETDDRTAEVADQ